MKRIIILLILLAAPASAEAQSSVNSQAKLNVYPIDCIFEEVSNGTGQIIFLTPEECGHNLTINPGTEQVPVNTPIGISNPNNSTRTNTNSNPTAEDQSQDTPPFNSQLFWPGMGRLAMLSLSLSLQPATLAGAAMGTLMISVFAGRQTLNGAIWAFRFLVGMLIGRK